mmetsp:Transcript_6509/g.5750  ORF Transcript_6509/g.5750 Transcript_6509/m.5750 type:complete len:88 (-) Transcript_6509:197-460(-)
MESSQQVNTAQDDEFTMQNFLEFLLALYLSMDDSSRDIFMQQLIDNKYKDQKLENKRKKSKFALTHNGKNHTKHYRNNKKKHAYHRW